MRNKSSKLMNDMMIRQYSQALNEQKSRPDKNEHERSLLAVIKNISDGNHSFTAHEECIEAVNKLKPEDAHQNKRYLIYMYKMILNRNSEHHLHDDFWKELKGSIVTKIYEAHASVVEKAKAEEELHRI